MGKGSRSRQNNGSSSSNSVAPWKDMFRSASFRIPKHDPRGSEPAASTSVLNAQRRVQHCNSEITSRGRIISMDRNLRSDLSLSSRAASSTLTVPWQDMFRSASFRRPADYSPRDRNNDVVTTRENNPADQLQQNRPSSTAAAIRREINHARPQLQNNPGMTAASTSENHHVQPRTSSVQTRPDPSLSYASSVMSLEGRFSPEEEPVAHAPEITNQAVQVSNSQIGGESSSFMGNNLNLDHLQYQDDIQMENGDSIQSDNQALSEELNNVSSPQSTPEHDIMFPNYISTVTLPKDPQLRMALYVTMAQAILAILLVIFYGGFKLLEEYLRPILWAVLCSIPIRGIQDTLVEFWSEPLRLGLTETILAIPVAVLKVLIGTIVDARDVFDWIFHGKELVLLRQQVVPQGTSGFLRLFRRLVSFGFFVFVYEQIGSCGIFTLLGVGFMFSSSGLYQTTVSAVSSLRSDSFRLRSTETNVDQGRIGVLVAHWILSRLKTILAVALILGIMFALLAGVIFFSYRIGVEAKDAVVSLNSHLEQSNIAEKLGIKRWIEENEVMEVVEWYTNECYETLWQQVDSLSAKYNLTEFMKLVKHLVISPPSKSSSNPHHPPVVNFSGLRNLKSVMNELLVTKEEMFEKAKCLATQGIDEFLRALGSSRFILDGVLNLVFSIGQSMVYGAAGLLNIALQSMVFFWVLFYLLTSESGGVTEQVVKMIPISKPTKERCIAALNNAISGVLVATAEIAFFQGCFTWLLCRLYSVHFVYMSTILAFISPLLPIFPPWLPALPAALQLILDRRYLMAASFCVTHLVLMDYGASEIAEDVPGYSAYLTGVSIIGGMTLFPSALEVPNMDSLQKFFPWGVALGLNIIGCRMVSGWTKILGQILKDASI